MASQPSILWKTQRAFQILAATPMVPVAPGPPTVELTSMDSMSMSTPRSSFQSSPVSPSSIVSTSTRSSIELDPSQQDRVRQQIADATRDML